MKQTMRYFAPLFVAWVVAASGCSTKQASSGAGGGNTARSSGQSSSTGTDPHYACTETMLTAAALAGPGYDATKGGFTDTPQSSYVVSTTQIYTDASQDTAFFKAFKPVLAELGTVDGIVAYSLGNDPSCHVYRTLVVWQSTEKMYAFVGSGAHANAAGQTKDISVTGKVTHWTASPDDVKALTWEVARMHLDQVQPLSAY